MKRVVIDPVSRIEGHLRVEVVVDESTHKVTNAVSAGTMWRGIELIVKNRDPRDVWAFTQRICGVCTTVHALASVRNIEDALDIEIPKNANYIRNIMLSSLHTHDHLVHFYHLHALDWVSPLEALKADPVKTSELVRNVINKYGAIIGLYQDYLNQNGYPNNFPDSTPVYFKTFQDKIKALVRSGQLGIFAANWWDHPDYKALPPEVHLLAITHYLNMLDLQRQLVIPHVVFGGKNPHPHYLVGGMACSISMNYKSAPINMEMLNVVEDAIYTQRDAINYFYLLDLLAIGDIYLNSYKWNYGGGLSKERVLGYGDFPDEPYSSIKDGDYFKKILYHSNGVVENFANGVEAAKYYYLNENDLTNPDIIQEFITHSWYQYPNNNEGLHPWNGITDPNFTGPNAPWKYLD